ncbi:hypothetical protein MUN89_06565 [Halobacillus salinarum]|uniref:Uncharacterized protein n=1 Tax=Halobacillus salinarum TaxID=2932257 RepID=A0ABY4EPN7_9BACI|nr:hypothetical protein [Halobacillus salinarum]UOQ45599.1 hypothetical protein MUN89_06565 [Halobacillus salinarum]
MKKMSSFIVLLAVFLLVGFVDSPQITDLYETAVFSVSPNNAEAEEVFAPQDTPSHYSSLEMYLERKDQVGDYIVETYREYEIYKDTNGTITKKVPTSNYNYLRYYKN